MIKSISILILCITSYSLFAQVEKNSELYKTIISKDSLLFNVGFNTCDIIQFENLLSENLEFIHDKDGLSNKKEFLYNLKNGLCGSPDTYQSRRELLKASTEIYPLYIAEIKNELVKENISKFEYWADPPYRTEKKIFKDSAFSEKDLINLIYPE